MKPHRRRFVAPLVLLLGLGVGATACKKEGDTNAPGTKDDKDDGLHLEYATGGFGLVADVKMSLELSGMGNGSLAVAAKGSIDATPGDGGKLKVVSRVDEVASYEASGDLKPKLEEGEEPPDMKEEMKGAETVVLVSARGEADEEASKALPENVAKKAEADAAKEAGDEKAQRRISTRSLGGQVITLPELPEVGLVEGKPIKVPTKEEERNLGGQTLPIEIDQTYHLQKIDSSSGARIATLSFKSAGSGAQEMQGGQGSVFVAYEEETEGTLLFDLDARLPVSLSVEQATMISFGDNSAEQYLEIEATYSKK